MITRGPDDAIWAPVKPVSAIPSSGRVAGVPIECQRQNGTAPVLRVELKLVRGVGQAVSVKVRVDLVLQGDVAGSRRKTRRITWVSAMPCFVDIREAVGVAIGE